MEDADFEYLRRIAQALERIAEQAERLTDLIEATAEDALDQELRKH